MHLRVSYLNVTTSFKEFGDMTITKGVQHDFLGMKIGFNKDKSVTVDMRAQIRQVIEEFEKFDTSIQQLLRRQHIIYLQLIRNVKN